MIQEQVINYILDTKDFSFILNNNLDETFFSDYTEEYDWIKSHFDTYGVIPDRESFIATYPQFDIIQVNETPSYLLTALYEDKNRRELASTFNGVRSLLNAGKSAEALALYISAVENFSSSTPIRSVDITENTSRYDEYVDKCSDFFGHYVTTGFKELDDIFGGWDRNEELATIVARSNMGKTWILLKCALAAAEQGLNVGVYSGEMSDTKVGYRVDTLLGHISNTAIVQGNISIQAEYKSYIDKLSNGLIKGHIRILTPAMAGGPATVSTLRAFIEKDKLDMLCIDQHSLLEDDRKARNPVERASNISRDLKNLQVMKKIPIITVSQQNRTDASEGVGLEQIAQSDRIGQDSTIVLFFEQHDGIMVLSLVKSRDSENGKKLHYAINFDKGTFQYMPAENDAVNGTGMEELHEEYDYTSGDEIDWT